MKDVDLQVTWGKFIFYSATKIVTYTSKHTDFIYEIYYDIGTDKVYILKNDSGGYPLLTYENYTSCIPYMDDIEYELWSFQALTVYDIDFDWIKNFLYELLIFRQYLEKINNIPLTL